MTTTADRLSFDCVHRRIARFLIWVSAAGALLAGAAGGWKWALGFLAGAVVAWFNLRWLARLVRVLGGEAPPSPFRLALRYFMLGAGAYVILRFSPVPPPSVIAGLLALIAAVFVEVVFELVYARKRTLDHQNL